MALITLAFVDAPGASPTTIESLTTSPAWASIEGFTLGAPAFDAPPQSIGGEYGYRTVSFTIKLIATYSASATKMQSIARQLLAEKNWLMLQWQTTPQPMFLRTYRTAQSALDWTWSRGDVWELPVTLVCDPWLYGARQTIGPITITNNPATGTNPMWYKFGASAILGDAPTGLKVDITPAQSWDDLDPMMASTQFTSTETGPYFWQTGGFTLGVATAVGPTTGMSGSNSSAVTPTTSATATTSGHERLTGAAPSNLPAGTYKVLLRVQRTDVSSQWIFNLGQLSGLATYTYPNPDVFLMQGTSTTNFATWVDLGEFSFPIGAGGLDAADVGTAAAPSIQLRVARYSGSAVTVNLDAFLLIPIDTATTLDSCIMRTTFTGDGPDPTINAVWDNSRVPPQFRAYASGVLSPLKPPRIDGRFLRVQPGVTNVFHLIQQTKIDAAVPSVNNTDVITDTAAVTFSYYPKYLYLRPDTT